MITPGDRKFLRRREQLLRYWNVVALLLLSGLAPLAMWLYFSTPALINPYYVAQQLQQGLIGDDLLQLMALFLPIMVIALIVTVVMVVLFATASFNNEKRYQRLLKQLQENSEP